jgi:hypothetical protein
MNCPACGTTKSKLVLLTLSLLACAKSPPDLQAGGTPSSVASTASATPASTAAVIVPIPILGISGRTSASQHVNVGGDTNMVLVEAGTFTARLWATKPDDPKTLAEAEAFAKNFNPKKLHSETLADGWAISFEAMGSNYEVIVGRDIAGKAYHCEATAESASDQPTAVAFCKSLTQ